MGSPSASSSPTPPSGSKHSRMKPVVPFGFPDTRLALDAPRLLFHRMTVGPRLHAESGLHFAVKVAVRDVGRCPTVPFGTATRQRP